MINATSEYESINFMYTQLSAQVLEHSASVSGHVRLSGDTGTAMLQSLQVAAAELLDIEYVARTAEERSVLVRAVLARICSVADTTVQALSEVDTHPAVLVTPDESRAILADCRALCA